jgi:hypothetical protein
MHTVGVRGRRGEPHIPPQKTSKNWIIKIKHENEPTARFSHNPKYPPQKNLKMTVHLWGETFKFKKLCS